MNQASGSPPVRDVIAIGCSWGGLRATSAVLEALPADLDAAVLVVQHRPHAPSDLTRLLALHTPWPVCEAEDKEPISARHVYLAPPGYHLLVDGRRFGLSTEAPVQHSRPSVDVLFETVADSFGPDALGIILTGANEDGAGGIVRLVRAGGSAIVQDPSTAERRQMPDAAIAALGAAGLGDRLAVLPLVEVGPAIARAVGTRRREGSASP